MAKNISKNTKIKILIIIGITLFSTSLHSQTQTQIFKNNNGVLEEINEIPKNAIKCYESDNINDLDLLYKNNWNYISITKSNASNAINRLAAPLAGPDETDFEYNLIFYKYNIVKDTIITKDISITKDTIIKDTSKFLEKFGIGINGGIILGGTNINGVTFDDAENYEPPFIRGYEYGLDIFLKKYNVLITAGFRTYDDYNYFNEMTKEVEKTSTEYYFGLSYRKYYLSLDFKSYPTSDYFKFSFGMSVLMPLKYIDFGINIQMADFFKLFVFDDNAKLQMKFFLGFKI